MELTPSQITTLERLLGAGFEFLSIERLERYVAVERGGFVALLDPSEGKLTVFGQAGYCMGGGIGMLVDGREGKAFVWHGRSVRATPELLAGYEQFRTDLGRLLAEQAGQTLSGKI